MRTIGVLPRLIMTGVRFMLLGGVYTRNISSN